MDQRKSNSHIFEAVRFHPFFQGVDERTALSLIEQCEEKHYKKSEIMLHAEQPRLGLLLVLDGIAEVYVKNDHNGREEVLEVVQKGEMIGFSSIADFLGVTSQAKRTKQETMVEVKAIEAVGALLIPFSVVTARWEDPNVHDYLLTQIAIRLKDVYGSLAEQVKLARNIGEKDAFLIRVQDVMTNEVAQVTPETTIQAVAQKMLEKRTSSVVVIEGEELKGIITERDLVKRVIASGAPLTTKAEEIMTKDPLCVSRFAFYYEAISTILLNGIKHLPVVQKGKVVGIVTLSDLLRKKNENVIKTIQKIEEADESTLPQIKAAVYEIMNRLIEDRVPVFNLLEIVTRLYDRLIVRVVTLSLAALERQGLKQPSPFAFYQMGSSGRGEQFMLTDQDHFLVYGEAEGAEAYFAVLGKEITNKLEEAGYALCRGGMMASEAQWRGTVGNWQDRLRGWMLHSTNDKLLLAQNFFSYRFVTGSQDLHHDFETAITETLQRSKIFLYRLTQVEHEHHIPTLDQPFRSLFKLDRKTLDMKKEVLFPYHHSLQILSLVHGGISGTPIEKIELLQEKGVMTKEFSNDLKKAACHILSIYIRQRWQENASSGKSSSVLTFAKLSTREKEELMLSLKKLRELQNQVFAHFSL